jgi:hypothetical protein
VRSSGSDSGAVRTLFLPPGILFDIASSGKSGPLLRDLLSHHDCLAAALWLRTGMPAEPPLTAGARACVLCGQAFREADMIHIAGSWVCAACKPLFVQRMTEGVGPTAGFRDLSRLTHG